MDKPEGAWGPAAARAKALLVKGRETIAAARNLRQIGVLRRALRQNAGRKK